MSDLFSIKTNLSLSTANTIVAGTLAAGREAKLFPLTAVVLDTGGHLIALQREDGSGIARVEIAIGKAGAALGMGMPGRDLRDRLKERVGFQAATAAAADGRFVPVPGGVLILDGDGLVIGAVGVSGDASDKDEYCAIAGVNSANLKPQPAAASAGWADAPL